MLGDIAITIPVQVTCSLFPMLCHWMVLQRCDIQNLNVPTANGRTAGRRIQIYRNSENPGPPGKVFDEIAMSDNNTNCPNCVS
ncbi:hypothetical protein M405DRAFT_808685 [Rhizopogon salebrosus TDB-379]|nr:hypothetical protein M405DRAFT_808685 [Rhizopogon salebrosus TDB-379]